MTTMKTTVVSGLLGAGKTTLIQNLLTGVGERVCVLVNDFGKAGIDGEIVGSEGVKTVELPSGCVCCTLRMDMKGSITSVLEEFAPDHLVIEPSGVASASAVLEVLAELEIEPVGVTCVVDATEFAELYRQDIFGPFFADQVSSADLVLINKTDLASEAETSEAEDIVRSLNPGAVVARAVRARFDGQMPAGVVGRKITPGQGHTLNFKTLSLWLDVPVTRAWADEVFNELAAGRYGKIVRAKALFETTDGPRRYDLAWGALEQEALTAPVAKSRLVVIGESMLEDELRAKVQIINL